MSSHKGTPITCAESDDIRCEQRISPLSSITNYVGNEVLNPDLPPITRCVWGTADGAEVLIDERDEHGCRHWRIDA